MSDATTPGEVKVFASFSKHLGPRFIAAGVELQFHYNQLPGVHLRVEISKEFREAIISGIKAGMADRFPNFPDTGTIWVTRVEEHPVDSSFSSFFQAARLAVELAFAQTRPEFRGPS